MTSTESSAATTGDQRPENDARISGSAVMVAMASAMEDRNSDYALAAFYLGVSAGQFFCRGWRRDELDAELRNVARSHPALARKITEQLAEANL